MIFRISIFAAILLHFHAVGAQDKPSKKRYVFQIGPKIGISPFLFLGTGSDLGDAWPMGVFVAYALHKEARLRNMSAGIEAGLYFRPIHVSIYEQKIASLANRQGPRRFGCLHEAPRLPVHFTSLWLPIVGKIYLARSLTILMGLSISFIMTARMKDAWGAFMQTDEYKALDKKNKSLDEQGHWKRGYACNTAYLNFKRTEWPHRRNKATSIPVRNMLSSRWWLGPIIGMQYEMDMGLSVGLTLMYEIGLGPSTMCAAGTWIAIGYDLNKLFTYQLPGHGSV